MMDRYQRQTLLPHIGISGQKKFAEAKVLIVGCGGLGIPVLQVLAGAGIGTIGISDSDCVDLTNLHRQAIFKEKDVGKPKTAIAQQYVKAYNSEIIVHTHPKLTEANATLVTHYDLVVDCCDNFSTRYLINDVCVEHNIPWVSGALSSMEGQVALFNHQGSGTYRCLFPEAPLHAPKCNTEGVWPALPMTIGTFMASEALQWVLGTPQLTNTLLIYQALTHQQITLSFSRSHVYSDGESHLSPAEEFLFSTWPLPAHHAIIWLDVSLPSNPKNWNIISGFENALDVFRKCDEQHIIFACREGIQAQSYALHPRTQEIRKPGQQVYWGIL